MSAKVITPYGDYINEPNATDLDHIPGDYGWPLLGHTFSYIKDPMAWAQERYKNTAPCNALPQQAYAAYWLWDQISNT